MKVPGSNDTAYIAMIPVSLEAARRRSATKNCQEVEKLTKKEFLNQYLNAEKEIGIKLDQIARLRELSTKITQTLTSDKVKSNSENRLESSVSKIVDIEREIGASIDQLERTRLQVESVINSVPNVNQRNVLRLRYISGKTWEQIAVDLDFSYQWVCELHGRALQNISPIVDRS